MAKTFGHLSRAEYRRSAAPRLRCCVGWSWLVLTGVLSCLTATTPDRVQATTAQHCDRAARTASQATGVPLVVLQAITRTETGRGKGGTLQPWPWTVNMEGVGRWFDTREAAQAYVDRHYARGARSFDVGCFQINYRWHGEAFTSIEAMFDPGKNALYAAQFLARLYRETGDWSAAAGAYHSRTPKFATRYAARFEKIRGQLVGDPPNTATVARVVQLRQNTFPLLRSTSAVQAGLGSLMPDTTGRGAFFGTAGGSS